MADDILLKDTPLKPDFVSRLNQTGLPTIQQTEGGNMRMKPIEQFDYLYPPAYSEKVANIVGKQYENILRKPGIYERLKPEPLKEDSFFDQMKALAGLLTKTNPIPTAEEKIKKTRKALEMATETAVWSGVGKLAGMTPEFTKYMKGKFPQSAKQVRDVLKTHPGKLKEYAILRNKGLLKGKKLKELERLMGIKETQAVTKSPKKNFLDKLLKTGKVSKTELAKVKPKTTTGKSILPGKLATAPKHPPVLQEQYDKISKLMKLRDAEKNVAKRLKIEKRILSVDKKAATIEKQLKYDELIKAKNKIKKDVIEPDTIDRVREETLLRPGTLKKIDSDTPKGLIQMLEGKTGKGNLDEVAHSIDLERGSYSPEKLGQPGEQLAADLIRDYKARQRPTPSQTEKEEIQRQITDLEAEGIMPKFKTFKKAGEIPSRNLRLTLEQKFKSTKTTAAEVKKEISSYAIAKLPPQERGKLLNIVRQAKTKQSLYKAQQIIDKYEENFEFKTAKEGLKKTIRKLDLKKTRPEYKEILTDLSDINMSKVSGKKFNKLSNMREYLEKHPENNIPQEELAQLDVLNRKNINDMTTSEIQTVDNAIKHFSHLHDVKQNKLRAIRVKRRMTRKKEILDNIKIKKVLDLGERRDTVLTKLKNIDKSLLQPRTMTSRLEGKEGGLTKVLVDDVNEGLRKSTDIQQKAEEFIGQNKEWSKWSERFHSKPTSKKVDYKTYNLKGGKTLKLAPDERMYIYLATKNKDTYRALVQGGIRLKRDKLLSQTKLTTDEIIDIAKDITPQQKAIADKMSLYWNTTQKELLNKTSLEINGYEIARDENYLPKSVADIDRMGKYAYNPHSFDLSLEGLGILKERVKTKAPLFVEGLFNVFDKSIRQASMYSGLAQPMKEAKMLMHDKEVLKAISQKGYEPYIKEFNKLLKNVETMHVERTPLESKARGLLSRAKVSFIRHNPSVVIKQPISYILAHEEVPAKYLLKALTSSVKETEALINKYSPFGKERLKGRINPELNENYNVILSRNKYLGKTPITSRAKLIEKADKITVKRIWKAIELKTKAENSGLKDDALWNKVAREWERTLELNQPTSQPTSLPGFLRGKSMVEELFGMFGTQRNKVYNMVVRGIQSGDRKKQTRALIDGIVSIYLVSLIDKKRKQFLSGKGESMPDTIDIVNTALGNILLLGNITKPMIEKFRGNYFASIENPLEDMLNKATTIPSSIAKLIENRYKRLDKKEQRKYNESVYKASLELADIIGKVQGLPLATYERYIKATLRKLLPEAKEFPKDEKEPTIRLGDIYKKKVKLIKKLPLATYDLDKLTGQRRRLPDIVPRKKYGKIAYDSAIINLVNDLQKNIKTYKKKDILASYNRVARKKSLMNKKQRLKLESIKEILNDIKYTKEEQEIKDYKVLNKLLKELYGNKK
jgi:hypothetical protein